MLQALANLNEQVSQLIDRQKLEAVTKTFQRKLDATDWTNLDLYCTKHQKRKLTAKDFAAFSQILFDCINKQDGAAPYARFTAWSRGDEAKQLELQPWVNCHITAMFTVVIGLKYVEQVGDKKKGTCRKYKLLPKEARPT